jgi:ketosteroid isomerase-like protein
MNPVDASVARDVRQRVAAAVNRHDAGQAAALCCDDVIRADPAGQQHEDGLWNS